MPPTAAIIVSCYAAFSLITFIAFALDKSAARLNRSRTSERLFHLLELVGGFPGALIAILFLRHKNRKPSFYLIPLVIAAAHVGAWYLVVSHAPGN